ncbi:MAG: hypothetical protein KAX80_03045, partial [Planctomycetes bacterium]|nr:hypothetical protein [Planctomycetota bacterium]
GIILLNTGEDLFSGVLAWIDLRLMGENFDPRRAPELTLTSTYNAERQGLHILVYPSRYGTDQTFLNFAMSFTTPHRLRPTPPTIDEWQDKPTGKPWDGYKPYWDVLRFFGVNQAGKVSPFESGGLIKLSTPGARANVFTRDGKVLLVVGLVPVRPLDLHGKEIAKLSDDIRKAMLNASIGGGVADGILTHLKPFMKPEALAQAQAEPILKPRRIADTVTILDPKALGLNPRRKYVVQDLLSHRYVKMSGRSSIPVRLNTLWPQVLLIEPVEKGSRIAHFTGAEGCSVRKTARGLRCTLEAAAGSPVALYIDPDGKEVSAKTKGFSARRLRGRLVEVAGLLPENRKVVVTLK